MTQKFLWPVPDSPPDEGTIHICGFNEEWLTIVVSTLQFALDKSIWDNPPDDIEAQVATLIDLIMTSLD